MMKAFIDHKSPTIKSLHLPEPAGLASIQEPLDDVMGKYGLIDSGATHPLRAARSIKELEEAKQTSVVLAGDQRISLPQTASGVILSETQPIVPLGGLVKTLGYEFVWNHKGCRLYHPTKSSIQVFTRSSCPEVRECDALRLISELEMEKVKEAMTSLSTLKAAIETAKDYKPDTWKEHLGKYVGSGLKVRAVFAAPFMKEIPAEQKVKILESFPQTDKEAWLLLKRLPLKRRQLWRSREWVVHLFSGKGVADDPLKTVKGEILEIDLIAGMDLKNVEVYSLLLWAAAEGRIRAVIGGPPCRTFTLLRHRELSGQSNAPKQVRSAESLWGLEGLSQHEQGLVEGDNQLILRMVWLWLVADMGRQTDFHRDLRLPSVAFGWSALETLETIWTKVVMCGLCVRLCGEPSSWRCWLRSWSFENMTSTRERTDMIRRSQRAS